MSVDSLIAIRFSKPLRVETVNSETVTLTGPKGIERIEAVSAEGGMLTFITPEGPLLPGSTYTVTLNGPVDRAGLLLPLSGFSFTTQPLTASSQPRVLTTPFSSFLPVSQSPDSEAQNREWDDDWQWRGKWKDGKPHSDWEDLPPLQAAPGVTALAGQVLDLRGLPLTNVILKSEPHYGGQTRTVRTDETGRFLIQDLAAGWNELIIDGRVARRRVSAQSTALGPEENHGVFKYGLKIKERETNVLTFTIWLPKIDTAKTVKISSPTTSEVVVTTPRIPGLEVRIPPGTVIYDHEHKVVTEVSITPIPVDRPPFPLPNNVEVPVYFTAQPGGAYLWSRRRKNYLPQLCWRASRCPL